MNHGDTEARRRGDLTTRFAGGTETRRMRDGECVNFLGIFMPSEISTLIGIRGKRRRGTTRFAGGTEGTEKRGAG
jgi:hypothetical protein